MARARGASISLGDLADTSELSIRTVAWRWRVALHSFVKITTEKSASAPEQHLAMRDPRLAALIARVGPFAVKPTIVRPFDALAESIAYQQLSGKAAGTIFGRVRALYPRRKWFSAE